MFKLDSIDVVAIKNYPKINLKIDFFLKIFNNWVKAIIKNEF